MLTLNISEADIERAKYERIYHPLASVRKRMDVLYWTSQGHSRSKVSDISGVHRNSIVTYIKFYHEGGLSQLMSFRYKGPESRLRGHQVTLEEYFTVTHLLAGRQLKVRQSILQMKQLPAEQKDDLLTYLENNEYRMKYDEYRNKGLMIGSGPIESAHRTLLQVRMKRSGQRWSDDGCDKMIKLRVALRSQKFDLITNIFRKSAA